jgi:hypothetical protein
MSVWLKVHREVNIWFFLLRRHTVYTEQRKRRNGFVLCFTPIKKLYPLSCLFYFFLGACQPTTSEDFQTEGRSMAYILLRDLRAIETWEDLASMEPILKRDFTLLVDLAIKARAVQQKNPDLDVSWGQGNPVLNESLVEEIRRIYEMEGGRECIERAQREAMLKLHAREKMWEKQQQKSVRLK